MLHPQAFPLFGRRLLASVKGAAMDTQHKYPVTGMTLGPSAIFVKDYFAKLHPKDLSEGQIRMKEAAIAWKSLDDASKKKYVELSKRYREEKIREFEALSEEEKKEMIASTLAAKEEKARRRTRKERRENWEKTGHPERPPSAYNMFVRERYNQLKEKGETITPVSKTMRRVSAEWKGLSESAKEPYVKKAEKLFEEYKLKLIEWKERNKPKESDFSKSHTESVSG